MASLTTACLYHISEKLHIMDTFASGVYINDIKVHGLSYLEALDTVSTQTIKYLESISIPLHANGKDYTLNASDFVSVDMGDILDIAFAAGKETSNADRFYTGYRIDTKKLRSFLEKVAKETDASPSDPAAVMNTDTRTFSFADGKSGKSLDVDSCIDLIVSKVEEQDYSPINLVYTDIEPTHTIEQVKQNTVLLAEFSSYTTNNFNRNTNIDLMCSYINGYEIKPGDVLSINDLVGQRTLEKGFLSAPAIMDGKRTVDDIGGGICQLSGTLYNAALLANMKIVERWPHSWPSDYLEVGLDSTLDWNTKKDLKIQNVTEYSMFLAAWLENDNLENANVLKVAVYGSEFPSGITVKVRSEIIQTYEPEPTKVTYTSSLSAGETQVVIKERTGYRTRVWRDFYLNGMLIDSEIIGTSYYAPIQGEVKKGRGSGGLSDPTPKPSTAPSPTPSAEPDEEPTIPLPTPTQPPIEDFGI